MFLLYSTKNMPNEILYGGCKYVNEKGKIGITNGVHIGILKCNAI